MPLLIRPKRVQSLFVVLMATVALADFSVARAASITVLFGGIIDSVDPGLAGAFAVGQSLNGNYVFESTVPARVGSNSTFAVFDALTALNFTLGAYSASKPNSAPTAEIQVDNNPPSPNVDRYAVVSRATDGLVGPPANGMALNFFSFRLDDTNNTVFNNALVLPTSLNLADFENRQFFVFFGPITSPSIVSGTITRLTVLGAADPSAVPIPSSLMLAVGGGLGGGCSGLLRRRRNALVLQS